MARIVLVAMAATLVPLPVMAGDSPAKSKTSTTSLRQVVAAEAARTPLRTSSEGASTQADNKASLAFFKSRTGMLALAVMAIGTGYAIYSAHHDRVKSPAKQ